MSRRTVGKVFFYKYFKLRKHTAGKQKEKQKMSITFNFDFLDQRSQSFCFIICFVSS